MKQALLILFLGSHLLAKDNVGCPQIDSSQKYPDGIPYCPDLVKENAFTVTRCAFDQAKSWHAATDGEKTFMGQLIEGLKSTDTAAIISNSEALKLQVCRSKKENDSFLLFYTKPGVKDYSGPFLMYREGGQTSGLVLHAPHDGQDGTNRSTRDAFQNSNALALISNGHPRGISGRSGPSGTGPYPSDWAHTRADLGYQAFLSFKHKFPDSIHIHIHGLAANKVMVTDSVGWESPHTLRGAFINAVEKALGNLEGYEVEAWRFNGWITGLAMTENEDGKGRDDNEKWVGTEFSVRLHLNTKVLTKSIINLETDFIKKPRAVQINLDIPIVADPNDAFVDFKEMGADGIIYAPVPRGKVGTKQLACVGVSYTNPINDYVTAEHCLDGAKNVADFYDKQSRGKLKLVPHGYHMDFPGNGWDVWEQAEVAAVKQFPADIHIIPNIFRKGGNHGGGGIAHVVQMTGWVWDHEVGHCLGLGHTGKYILNTKGQWEYHQYEDPDSVMGNSGFKGLTAPQYYHQGWLNKEEAALWELGKTYELKRVLNFEGIGLTTVIIKNKQFAPDKIDTASPKPRDLFISYPPSCDNCAALHLSNDGSSQRIAVFKDEYYDDHFTGLHAKIVEAKDKTIQVIIDYDKAPSVDKK